MSKAYLIDELVKEIELTKTDAGRIVDVVFSSISKSLKKGEPVSIVGFGTFSVKKRSARTGRNPQTGQEIKIKARKVPVFKAGKGLKQTVS